jgi:polysaccharide pyruvyl transferase WcaK-like protein
MMRVLAGRFPDACRALRCLRDASVLHIAGGGNLTSDYAQLLQARTFLAVAAGVFGVPVVVTGQQVGPRLYPRHERILKKWLPHARLVGVRDAASAETCRRLGVPGDRISVTGDDAVDLVAAPLPDCMLNPRRPVIGLSLHHHGCRSERDAAIRRLADVLGPWLRSTSASIVMIPHIRSTTPLRCDVRFAEDFTHALGDGLPVLIAGASEYLDVHVKALTAGCDFMVTTRFHGAVFALSSGVPTFPIGQDEYTSVKFSGLWEYFGLPTVVAMLGDGDLSVRLNEAWRERESGRVAAMAAMRNTRHKFGQNREATRRTVAELLDVLPL